MKKAVIIGAGPAGLTAGYELLKNSKDYEVTILEASDVVGGISRTVEHNGNRMDIGGHRFFSKSAKVNRWWNDILPRQGEPSFDDRILNRDVPLMPTGPDPEVTDDVMLNRRRVSRIYFEDKFIDYPIKMNSKTLKSLGLGETWKAGFSYLGGNIVKRHESSLEDFYINRFGRKLYAKFFEGYTEKLWGRHPKNISPDWGAQRASGLSMGAIVKDAKNKTFNKKTAEDTETSLIERFLYPKYGPGQLWEKTASLFQQMGGSIHFKCNVTRVVTDGNQVLGVYCDMGGEEIFVEADVLISSMPIKDLVGGMNDVPRNVAEIAYGLPYRDFVTIGLLLPKLSVENNTDMPTLGNIIPDCWIYVQDTNIKLGRIQIYNNWSPYLVADPEHSVWVGLEYFCTEGDYYWNLTENQWQEQAVSDLIRMKLIAPGTEVLDYHREAVKKAYPGYFDTYKKLDEVVAYLNGFNNLYCIGRNGQHRYNNMDHSMLTAFETVECILKNKLDKSSIWNVNIEQSYIEEKKSNVNTALLSKEESVGTVANKAVPVAKPAVPPQRAITAPEDEPKPLPRRIRRYPVPNTSVSTSEEANAGINATADASVVNPGISPSLGSSLGSSIGSVPAPDVDVKANPSLGSSLGSKPVPEEAVPDKPVPAKPAVSVFANPGEEIRMPENLRAARREYLASEDPITQRSIVKKEAPKLNKDAENYGTLQDASASSLVLGKSGLIDKTEEEVLKENEAFLKAQEDAIAYESAEEEPTILRDEEQFGGSVDREAALKEKELKNREAWQNHLEEVKRQEERNAEIKKIIANGKVIKSTTRSTAVKPDGTVNSVKPAPAKESAGRVIAVIKNGVAVPVDDEKKEVKDASRDKKGMEAKTESKASAPATKKIPSKTASKAVKTEKAVKEEKAESKPVENPAPKKRTRKPKETIVEAADKEEFIENPIVKEITIVNDPTMEVAPAPKRGRKKKTEITEEVAEDK